jgi:hypothetical protein
MSDTQIETPDNNRPAAVPTAETVVQTQVQTCLQVANTMLPILFMTSREIENGDYAALDGEAQVAAAGTFIQACARLDAMLGDTERWKPTTNNFIDSMLKTHESARDMHDAQIRMTEQIASPSSLYKPTIAQTTSGFMAYYGTTLLPNALIVGAGSTPAEALADFDVRFNLPPDQQRRLNKEAIEKLRVAELGETEVAPAPPPSLWQRIRHFLRF